MKSLERLRLKAAEELAFNEEKDQYHYWE